MKSGRIYNYTEANPYFEKVVKNEKFIVEEKNWEWLENEQRLIEIEMKETHKGYRDLNSKWEIESKYLNSILSDYNSLRNLLSDFSVPKEMSIQQYNHPISVVNFLREHGLQKLFEELQLYCIKHKKNPDLFYFSSPVSFFQQIGCLFGSQN